MCFVASIDHPTVFINVVIDFSLWIQVGEFHLHFLWSETFESRLHPTVQSGLRPRRFGIVLKCPAMVEIISLEFGRFDCAVDMVYGSLIFFTDLINLGGPLLTVILFRTWQFLVKDVFVRVIESADFPDNRWSCCTEFGHVLFRYLVMHRNLYSVMSSWTPFWSMERRCANGKIQSKLILMLM